jgi:hypothetical protein
LIKISIKARDGRLIEKIVNKTRATIGRSLRCDVPVSEESLSREHCLIEVEDGEIYVTDLDSANGVFIEGRKLKPSVKTHLTGYRSIQLGIMEMTVTQEITGINKLQLDQVPNRLVPKVKKSSLGRLHRSPENLEANRTNNPLSLLISSVVFLAVVGYLVSEVFKKKNSTLQVSTEKSQLTDDEKRLIFAQDEFKAAKEYTDIATRVECLEACRALGMTKGEGLEGDRNNTFFVVAPWRHTDRINYPRAKDHPDYEVLLALYLVFKSQAFNDLAESNIGQIHVIVKNQHNIASKILRLHRQHFPVELRQEVFTDLVGSLESGNAQLFWGKYRRRIPELDI